VNGDSQIATRIIDTPARSAKRIADRKPASAPIPAIATDLLQPIGQSQNNGGSPVRVSILMLSNGLLGIGNQAGKETFRLERRRFRQDTLLRALAWKCFFSNPKSFFCDQGSCSKSFDGTAGVPPAIYSIPTRVRTIIPSSDSPTLWGGRVPNQTGGLNHDHGMTRAVLHANSSYGKLG